MARKSVSVKNNLFKVLNTISTYRYTKERFITPVTLDENPPFLKSPRIRVKGKKTQKIYEVLSL